MPRLCTRTPVAADLAAFVEFERSNRGPFEQFNEPHPPGYYSDHGLRQAFDRLMQRQDGQRFLARVITRDDGVWIAKGSLTVHSRPQDAFAMLAYQTDRRHWKQGAASLLVGGLVHEACALGLSRVEALIASDNTVSLHLLRRAGFSAAGWASQAALLRGHTHCLRLSRVLRGVVGHPLARTHMHLPT